MIIESIELKNYRNYENLQLELSPGTNIFYGDNAQGKTNILESVYVCCTTKSHKGSKDKEMIRFGEDEAHIKLTVRKQDVPYRIDMHLKKNMREVKLRRLLAYSIFPFWSMEHQLEHLTGLFTYPSTSISLLFLTCVREL